KQHEFALLLWATGERARALGGNCLEGGRYDRAVGVRHRYRCLSFDAERIGEQTHRGFLVLRALEHDHRRPRNQALIVLNLYRGFVADRGEDAAVGDETELRLPIRHVLLRLRETVVPEDAALDLGKLFQSPIDVERIELVAWDAIGHQRSFEHAAMRAG